MIFKITTKFKANQMNCLPNCSYFPGYPQKIKDFKQLDMWYFPRFQMRKENEWQFFNLRKKNGFCLFKTANVSY